MKKIFSAVWLLLICLIPHITRAGDTLNYRFITLDSAVAQGLAHSHQLQLSGAQLAEIQSSFSDIKNRALPSVILSVGYNRLSNIPTEYFRIPGSPELIPSTALFPVILNNYAATASLRESVFNGFLLKYATLNMQYREESAEYLFESKENDIRMEVISSYLALFKLRQAHYLIEQTLQQTAVHVKEVNDFAAHGIATQNDVLRVKLEESNTKLKEIDIDNQLLTVNYDMAILLGLPDSTTIYVDSTVVFTTKTILPLSYYLLKATENRADLKALDMKKNAAQVAIKETKSDLYPKLSIAADYNYLRPNPRIIPPLDQFQPTWDVGIQLTYNLTNLYTNKNKTDVDKAKLAQTEADYAELNDNVKMKINQCYLQYKQSLEKIEVAQKSVEQAQENYKLVKSRYDNHIALITDLTDADSYLFNAKIDLIAAKADSQEAYYTLLKSAGELNIK